MDAILRELYYHPKSGFTGAKQLYKIARKEDPSIKQSDVTEWVKQQEVAQISQPRRTRYNSFVADAPLQQFQIDLIFLTKAYTYQSNKYMLTCVDIFSKVADAAPLKSKDSGAVMDAMADIIERMGVPKEIYSDLGAEFDNAVFRELCDSMHIKLTFTIDHAPFIEAFNRTLKNRIHKYMRAHNTKDWVAVLPDILDGYNTTEHSATGMAPNDVTDENKATAYFNMKSRAKYNRKYEPIAVGDRVRLPIVRNTVGKSVTAKGYYQQWSKDVYAVKEIDNALYKVAGKWHPRKDLQLVKGDVQVAPGKLVPPKVSPDDAVQRRKAAKRAKLIAEAAAKEHEVRETTKETVETGRKLRARKAAEPPKPAPVVVQGKDKFFEIEAVTGGPKEKIDPETGKPGPAYRVKWKGYKTERWQMAHLLIQPGVKKLIKEWEASNKSIIRKKR